MFEDPDPNPSDPPVGTGGGAISSPPDDAKGIPQPDVKGFEEQADSDPPVGTGGGKAIDSDPPVGTGGGV